MRFLPSQEFMAQHNELGKKGEQLAVEFLLTNNYEIIERNYRFDKAEVDIIAKQKETLAIIEVKTRSSNTFGDPKDFVNKKKIKLLISAINQYVCSKHLDVEVRFDVIGIIISGKHIELEHLEDAFYHF